VGGTLAKEHKLTIPLATYRLQFTKDFGFKSAASIAPYLAKLGISHVYASPYLKARPGSTHGYDIINHVELNPELGSQADFVSMVDAFKANGLGQILDFVPNHMGVGGADNRWWLDVLEWGPQSEYAAWFDIDWRSGHEYLHDKLLVPLLGDHFGVVLESGDLQLRFDADEGTFAVWAYGSHKLPICPRHYGLIIGDGSGELERLGDAFSDLTDQHPQTMNRARRLKQELSAACCKDPQLVSEISEALMAFNGQKGDLETWERLNALIAKQSWRLAHFRVASDDINYRRFFNVNDLPGVRMEIPELFDHAHSLVFKLLGNGTIDGIRLDHIDGLLDPKAYCLRIREKAPVPFYLLVEKILAPHEHLRESWQVDGTTGYEFANLLTGLLTHPSGEKHLTDYYRTFTNSNTSFEDTVRNCKLQIMENEMASELGVLARGAGRVARSNPRTADFTDNVLHRALRDVVACFPVYRTYVDTNGAAGEDRRDLDWAFSRARRENSQIVNRLANLALTHF
jgi:(1->4)-alpha-D-glucan 1-alpha-D-glucosylmutase